MFVTKTAEQSKTQRQRGVVLTPAGLYKLQIAIQALEASEISNSRLTLEKLSERINISSKTLGRLWSLNSGVDQKTLKLCFNALDLELHESDYTRLSKQTQGNHPTKGNQPSFPNLSYPDGPIGLDSPFYIERPPVEALAYQEIVQPGSIIQIRSPKGMGKGSLVLRLLAFCQLQKYRTATLDFCQFDTSCLANFNRFLRCFCFSAAKSLEIEPQLNQHWHEDLGGKLSCSFYFKNYLLKQIEQPIVLVLNDVDHIFEYSDISKQFFLLLRSWYEESRQSSILQKLRIVLVQSTEGRSASNINPSLFDVGMPLRLPELTHAQVQDLAQRYGLNWSPIEVNQLMQLLGGHPLLIQIAFYHICCKGLPLEQLLQQAIDQEEIFKAHLSQLWLTLHRHSDLVEALKSIVNAERGVALSPIQAHFLESQGLICYEGTAARLRCQLYQGYFKQQFQSSQRERVSV
ncbi:AAA-like domain-containing protein [Leptolyngbya ohadii]|uniref:AAA-like domain-containing protein n=1 Tax=Leptolyngbya ohadii TaxID=1962290 RepID=UPI000B599A1F|nr:AAA-like domain-containing protein [Leptolyngbya ohadii]